MVKKILLLLLLLSGFGLLNAATWTVLLYADSSDNLSDMIIKNITDIMRAKPNDTVNFFMQLHAYYTTALRYRITAHGLAFIEEVRLSDDAQKDFISGAQWAFNNNPADYTMLIISDHGWGILEPHWNEESELWQANGDQLSNSCMITRSHIFAAQHKNHKGFLFRTNPRTYLRNQQLVNGLAYITKHALHGKKLDILAFDTCMGNMFEIGLITAPYAQFLVGNQSCSLTDGFAFEEIIHHLNQKPSAYEAAEGMVQAFDSYYRKHDESGIYTHGAVDLSQIGTLNSALNALVDHMLTMPEYMADFIKACDASPRFCMWPMYTDLIALCKNIEEIFEQHSEAEHALVLKKKLAHLYHAVSSFVIARCGGFSTEGLAHGFAIYLPTFSVDPSYYETNFVHESQWVKFLEFISAGRQHVAT